MNQPPDLATSRSRLPSLTGMRFVAALMVFCFHAGYENVFADQRAGDLYSTLFSKSGWAGVSFFFILSGFLLTWSAREKDTPRAFWRRRFFKIYPNHALTFLAALVLMLWAGDALTGAVPNLLLLQTWVPANDIILGMNPVSWSLSVEAAFYLAFPLLLFLIRKIPARRLWFWAAGTVAAVLCMPMLAQLLFPGQPDLNWLELPELHYWFIFAFPPVRTLDFLLGMLMAEIVRRGKWVHTGMLPAVAACAAGYLIALEAPFAYGMAAATLVPFAWLITAAAVADVRGTFSPFRGRTMLWLGEASFAFYLIHRLVQIYGHRLLGADRTWSTPAAIGVLVLAAGVTLLLSWLVLATFERPLMRRFGSSRRSRRNRDAGSAPPGTGSTPPDAGGTPPDAPRTTVPAAAPTPGQTPAVLGDSR